MPFALCAMGALALILQGCDNGSAPSPASTEKPTPAAVQPRQLDESYQKTLSADRIQYAELVRRRNAIAEKMEALIEAKKAELKTDDLDKVKVALDRDPLWKTLEKTCLEANARVERQRQVAQGDVRERMRRELAERQAVEKQNPSAAKPSVEKGKAPVRVLPAKTISK